MTREEVLASLKPYFEDNGGFSYVGRKTFDRLLNAFMLVQHQRDVVIAHFKSNGLEEYDDEIKSGNVSVRAVLEGKSNG